MLLLFIWNILETKQYYSCNTKQEIRIHTKAEIMDFMTYPKSESSVVEIILNIQYLVISLKVIIFLEY